MARRLSGTSSNEINDLGAWHVFCLGGSLGFADAMVQHTPLAFVARRGLADQTAPWPRKGVSIVSTLKNLLNQSLAAAALTVLTAGMAHATAVFSTTATLTAADQVQSGRVSRNNVSSDWSTQKPYPGLVAGAGLHYQTFDLDMSALQAGYSSYGQYIQISIDSVSTTTFLAAYLDSYDPGNQAVNFLGDPGTSGNFFGVDPLFYQVIVPAGHHLVLVFNETAANGGLGQAANILVEAFRDTEYTDLTRVAAVPEPASLQLALLALAGLAARRVVRKRNEKSAELLPA